ALGRVMPVQESCGYRRWPSAPEALEQHGVVIDATRDPDVSRVAVALHRIRARGIPEAYPGDVRIVDLEHYELAFPNAGDLVVRVLPASLDHERVAARRGIGTQQGHAV